jgi:DNA polymerase-3 subunit delta
MAAAKPTVYIIHGDDEFALAKFVSDMADKMGDPVSAGMNITYLAGKSLDRGELIRVTSSLPFLCERRLVVLSNPLGSFKGQRDRNRFKEILEQIPATTALIIRIDNPLVDSRGRRRGQTHWLEKWAQKQDTKAFIREYTLPKGPQMARWIQTQAKASGGEFSFEAAGLLSTLVNNNPRLATQEIEKLLAYTNYQRPVEPDDVEYLVAYTGEASIFEMVDALGTRNGRQAQRLLHQLLAEDDPLRLFGMIVRQFRMLLITRELVDHGHREGDIARALGTPPFVVRKLMGQIGNFNLQQLEDIYRKLLEIDEGIKTGRIEGAVALDTLVAALTT